MKSFLIISGDAVAVSSILGSSLHVLPAIVGVVAGCLAVVWYAIQIWDRVRNKQGLHHGS